MEGQVGPADLGSNSDPYGRNSEKRILILINSLFVCFFFLQKVSVKNEVVAVSNCVKGEIMKATAHREKNFCLLSE